MPAFDIHNVPLRGSNLIEASAGTGKTYTIASLYLRLVVEQGVPVESILVVTYTKAATAELRERIRARLVQMLDLLRSDGNGADGLRAMLPATLEPALALQRLRHALLGFDRAAIFTIHGFCQRALADRAFESGMPFASEMLTEQRPLLQQIIDDFWRLRVQQLSPELLAYLMPLGITPDALANQLRGFLGRPYLQLRGARMPARLDTLEADYLEQFRRTRRAWRSAREQVEALLRDSTALNRNRYRTASLPAWLVKMDEFLGEQPGPWFEQFGKFSSTALAAGVRKGGEPPEHPFFERCTELLQAREALLEAYEGVRVALLQALVEYADAELAARKRAARQQYYDDLLINLQQALAADTQGDLQRMLRADYQAALIDEFQDTDPVQYDIFRRLFQHDELPLFLVGDPKQAIYSFRGADIFTYLQAAQACAAQHTLGRNWRSTPELIEGVNSLFNQNEKSFIYREIEFHASAPAECGHERLTGDPEVSGALCMRLLQGPPKREQALHDSVAAVAREVARLLRLGATGCLRVGARPLIGSDIALLVRTNEQGGMLKQALLALGIASVQQAQADVFHSQTALQLDRLLRAVVEPEREGLVRAALATDLLGFDGNRLAGLDETQLEREMIAFRGYHRQWREAGFVRMFRQLLSDRGVAARLLGFDDGERRLTDLLHLAELLHQRARAARSGMVQLLQWLAQQRQAPVAESDASQLRLESDGELVQIVTIHKSKGLEYPVVFVPFGWEAGVRRMRPGAPYTFHDPERNLAPLLELGSDRWEIDRHHAEREALAESLRLLYVAVTRARYRCYLYWGRVDGAEHAPLAWLLHPPAEPEADLLDAMQRHFKSLDGADLARRLDALAAGSPVAISWAPVDAAGDAVARQDEIEAPKRLATLTPRRCERRPGSGLRTTSFSALVGDHADTELPDHERHEADSETQTEPAPQRTIFTFPRGARAGSCLHAVFERIDFSRPEQPPLRPLVKSQLELHGIDTAWSDVVCSMVLRVLRTPLDPGRRIRLERVTVARRMVEMGFHYPLAAVDRTVLINLCHAATGDADSPLLRTLERLDFRRLRGFMKGFIDLVFELDGRYYLADYKSNWLGEAPGDYASEPVDAAMLRAGYHLQYLLYTLALHRYLRTRLPDYDYDRHFGGVYYLFLRGMDSDAGQSPGIFSARPDAALIAALDGYFSASGDLQR